MDKIPGSVQFKGRFEERYKELIGPRYEEFIACSTSWLRKSVRVNTIKIDVDTVKHRLSKNWSLSRIPWCPEGFWVDSSLEEKRYDIGNTLEHILGLIYVQESASMIPPVVLGTMPGDVVLDLCAAPGSKTSQMAAMMENSGVIVANDVASDRLKALGINLQRMGVKNALVCKMDGASLVRRGLTFDRVLVDAPCSATGTIRKSLMSLKMWSPGFVSKMAKDQKKLILAGFDVLKQGGTMVYSTCTLEPEENEGVVDFLLKSRPEAHLDNIELEINRSPAMTSWQGSVYSEEISKCLRIYPQDNDSEGFFIARIVKR